MTPNADRRTSFRSMDKSDKTARDDREAKLAEALRANLRRRKAADRSAPKSPKGVAGT